MADNLPKKYGGIKMRLFNIVIAGLALILAVILLHTTTRTITCYTALQDETKRYIRAHEDATVLQQASDYLTYQVQLYAATGDWKHVEAYFEEADVTRRREAALADLNSISTVADTSEYLENALNLSNELMGLECHAIRLIMEAQPEPPADIPEAIDDVVLTADEVALSPGEKRIAARRIIFGEEYLSFRNEISENVLKCAAALTSIVQDYQMSNSTQLLNMLNRQQVFIVLLLLVVLLGVFLTSMLIIKPLVHNVKHVRASQRMEVAGAFEVRFLAENYNEMYERTARDHEQLSYEATHDPLTGLYNRKAYEKAMESCHEKEVALLIIDIDYFKSINDTFGHDIGDVVLKRVSGVLQQSFRADDYVCRIGGDEFAVLMMHVTSDLKPLVEQKINRITSLLRDAKDNSPGVTLSIGVAFSDRKNPSGALFKDADRTLYVVKEAGRNGHGFYDDI